MKLAIVGSRNFTDRRVFLDGIGAFKQNYPGEIECIISGGARGADSLAKWYADVYNIPLIEYKPKWKIQDADGKWINDRSAGLKRNVDIVNAATHVLAFPSRTGSGTQHSMSLANKQNKPVAYFYID